MWMRDSRKRYLWIFILLISGAILSNCGKDADEERDSAILEAEIFLSSGKCQEAIDVLEAVGRDNSHARYLITLASSYACRGGFNANVFFGTNLALVTASAALTPANTFGGFVRFSTSARMTEPRDEDYEDILEAVNILLYAGGFDRDLNPTIARRSIYLQAEEQKEVRAFLTYLLMTHIGQYLYHYGNGSTTGVKGTRVGGGNACLADYSNLAITDPVPVGGNATLDTFLDNTDTGTCNSAGSGSADLGTAGSLDISRMCQLVVGMNNLFEVLPVFLTDTTGSSDFGGFGAIDTLITAAVQALRLAQPSTDELTRTQSQVLCEQNNTTDTQLQYYFAILVETLFI